MSTLYDQLEGSTVANDSYLQSLKDGAQFKAWVGFRVWSSPTQTKPFASADSDQFTIGLIDWNIKEEETDEKDEPTSSLAS